MMSPRVYVTKERAPTAIPIEEVYKEGQFDILPEVQAKEYFDVRFQKDRLTITAGKYVGLIPLNSRVVIQVEPKMPVANLLTILAVAGGSMTELPFLQREYAVTTRGSPEVLPALARAFVAAMRGVEVQGLRKEYQRRRTSGETVKGQVVFGASLQRYWSQGIRYGAVSDHYELSADITENRLLRFACDRLLRQHRRSHALHESVSQLAHFAELLYGAGVQAAPPMSEFVNRGFDPTYRRALDVARMVVYDRGIRFDRGNDEVSLPSFLIDLETLFEAYVRKVLSRRLPHLRVLDGNKEGQKALFDDVGAPLASPDVVLRNTGDQCVGIAEVKYKTVETRDDLNQVLGYGVSYRTGRIVLVLPAEAEADAGMSLIGSIGGTKVWRYRFNLAAADLNAEEARCGDAFHYLTEQPAA